MVPLVPTDHSSELLAVEEEGQSPVSFMVTPPTGREGISPIIILREKRLGYLNRIDARRNIDYARWTCRGPS